MRNLQLESITATKPESFRAWISTTNMTFVFPLSPSSLKLTFTGLGLQYLDPYTVWDQNAVLIVVSDMNEKNWQNLTSQPERILRGIDL